MDEYSIEVRLAGYPKEYIRRLMYAASRRFKVAGSAKNHPLPTIVLYGPFRAEDQKAVADAVADVAAGYDLVSYRIKGFDVCELGRRGIIFGREKRGICFDIEPSEKLLTLRGELAGRLGGPGASKDAGTGPLKFHAPLDFGDMGDRFERVLEYLRANEERDLSQRLVRLAVVKNRAVVCEYDLVQKRMITLALGQTRGEKYLRRTFKLIKQTGDETFQPIWTKAQAIAGPKSRVRQVTLVEDNPKLRIPRLFVVKGLEPAGGAVIPKRGRQLTLLEDRPEERIPRALLWGAKANVRKAAKPRDGTKQTNLFGGPADGGYLSSLRNLHRRLKKAVR
jgi:hypothetical protein